ncbi:Metallo-dependent phosphatase-like protein [Thermothelomyces heterothallicus CBS 202.75]|uniref:Metallo-dependent phosphatase-like protein n=1 Tax=Thermothelomyces heterothallicus CBS 202.75 TaxID=1149848 RepID=UPI003742905B
MAPQSIAQLFPRHRRGPSRPLILLIAGLAFLTLCLFASHLPVLRHFTSVRPFGASTDRSRMTSAGPGATSPHQHHQGPSEAQVLLDLIEREKAKKFGELTMEYGTNKHPSFRDDPPLLIADLPREHVPSHPPPSLGDGENRTSGKRLVIVGDVHGHRAALEALLRKIGFDHRNGDHLILAGDMVTKGPDSKGVVELAMEIGASAVRGNQDDKVLATAREIGRFSVDGDSTLGPATEEDDEQDEVGEKEGADGRAETKTRRKANARRVARSLTRSQLAWIRSLPLILRVGNIPGATSPPWNASTLVVIHGGLVPGLPPEKQDPWAVMNMRGLIYPRVGKGKKKNKDKDGKHHARDEPESEIDETETDIDETDPASVRAVVAIPTDSHGGEPWSHAWNRYQNNLPPTAPRTVAVYGHDAKAGLQVDPVVDISPYSGFPSSSKKKKNKKNKKNKHKDKNGKDDTNDAAEDEDKAEDQGAKKGIRYAFGLDSGCGHGRQLTALVIESGADGIKHRIEQVDCADVV